MSRGRLVRRLLLVLAVARPAPAQENRTGHPLDPLSGEEIATAVEVLKAAGRAGEASRFPIIALREPTKGDAIAFRSGAPLRRQVFAVVYERARAQTFEAVVDLESRRVSSWKEVPGVQPSFLLEDLVATARIVRADPRWQEAMRRRGITDFENVQIEPGPAGYRGDPAERRVRMTRAVCYYRGRSQNPYARPIEGVAAYVDVNAGRVVELVDTGLVPVPRAQVDFDLASDARPAGGSAPVPARPASAVEVRGHEIRWDHWRFRYALHPREGLVLYTVAYGGGDQWRSVMYRASLSEMVVPYADPGPTWSFRAAFDEGEYGLGRSAASLEGDVPDDAIFFDAAFADDRGRPYEVKRAVAVFERDGGLLWKHVDYVTGQGRSRRARELVIGYAATAANYTYAFNWIFRQDGSLELEVIPTGVMLVKALPPAPAVGAEPHGHRVSQDLEAVHHQHFFVFRLDLDVDGVQNSVVEVNTEAAVSGAGDRQRTAFAVTESTLRTEQEAKRSLHPASSRSWKVLNRSVRNALGQPTGYALVPRESSVPYASPDSWIRRRAGFLDAPLWVTPYEPEEIYAAGDYVNQSAGGDGLPRWTASNRSIEDRDVVLWYTLGITHTPRPEDWPVVSSRPAGFRLIPDGFFSRNPGLAGP